MLYICILRSMLFGIFSSKEIMQIAVESHIKYENQKRGMPLGDFHFKYFTMKPDEPYLSNGENYNYDVSKALFSFSTLHSEYFKNKIETDWKTGKILKI